MGPACNLGNDPAEAGVLLDARRDRVGEEGGASDNTDPGLIAGGLNAEDEGLVHVVLPVLARPSIGRSRMMMASIPRS